MTFIPLKAPMGIAALAFAAAVMPLSAAADSFVFSTGNPDGLMATATRPESPGKFEIETGMISCSATDANHGGSLHRPNPVGSVHQRYQECSRRGLSRFSQGF